MTKYKTMKKVARSPEMQKRIDEWHKSIGQSLVDNLNSNVLKEKRSADEAPEEIEANCK